MTMVDFIDLGANNGDSSWMLWEGLRDAGYDLAIHCVEPNPPLAEECRSRFSGLSFVRVHEVAVASAEGTTKLYLQSPDRTDMHGSSLYRDKVNVTDRCVEVRTVRFSDFYASIRRKGAVSVLKANIEGAEYDLVMDMQEHGLFEEIDILMGAAVSPDSGWLRDMAKIPSLKPKIPMVRDIIAAHGRRVERFAPIMRGCLDVRRAVDAVVRDREAE